jgi:anti-sigma factor RsiW
MSAPHLSCADCQQRLQDYVDGGLAKPESMRIFLHVRECEACTEELTRLEQLVALLEALPEREAPADFDARVLAAVPYDSYRAMAGLRRARVPVFLERDSLPAWVRSPATRIGGAVIAGLAVAGRVAGIVPDAAFIVAATGLVPELAVQLQALARRTVLAVTQAGERA